MSALGKEIGWGHEQGELQSIIAAMKPGGTYLDVGAHVGGFAIPVALAHPDVEIHLFEPVPRTRSWLQANLARNGVTDRVTIWPNAVGAESSRGTMTGVDGASNHLAESGKAGPGSVDVEIETLDGLLLDIVGRVDVIKCDIEGGELPAMRGAEKISASRPSDPRAGDRPSVHPAIRLRGPGAVRLPGRARLPVVLVRRR